MSGMALVLGPDVPFVPARSIPYRAAKRRQPEEPEVQAVAIRRSRSGVRLISSEAVSPQDSFTCIADLDFPRLCLAFFQASRFACAFAQIEQFRAANAGVAFDFDM